MKICEICGKPLLKQKRFCSYSCRNVWRNKIWTTGAPPVILKCQQCGIEFRSYRSLHKGKNIFCSQKCLSEWKKEAQKGSGNPRWDKNYQRYTHCLSCGKELPAGHKNWRRKFCSRGCAGCYKTPEIRARIGQTTREHFRNPKIKQKHRDGVKKAIEQGRLVGGFQKFRHAEWFVRKMWEGLRVKPNKPETTLENILNTYFPNEWRYNKGEVILNSLVPDFINVNGRKAIIEFFGDYWHRGEDSQQKVNRYKTLGYKTLVIWEHELNELPEKTIASKVAKFMEAI